MVAQHIQEHAPGPQRRAAVPCDWLDELHLDPSPPYLHIGLRAIDPERWLVRDALYDEEMAYKRWLLADRGDKLRGAQHTLLGTNTGIDEASRELSRHLTNAAAWFTPVATDTPDPFFAIADQIQEDLAMMQLVDGTWHLTAVSTCFPSHWTPTAKIGMNLDQMHRPVTHYSDELQTRVNRFHDRLVPGKIMCRRNCSINRGTELCRLSGAEHDHAPLTVADDGSPLYLRSERQTLFRLHKSASIAFTIRVQLAPLGVLRDRPDIARQLHDALQSWDQGRRDYNSTGPVFDAVVPWLDRVGT